MVSAEPVRWRSRKKASISRSWRAGATSSNTAAEIKTATGVTVVPAAGDIATPEGRAAALKSCPESDILVNNADGPAPGDFRKWTRDDWISALDTMMLCHIEMMRLTVHTMTQRGFGRIINIVSRSVKTPQIELGLSNGARSGLVGFVVGLARQTVTCHDQQSAARHLRQRRPATVHQGHARGRPVVRRRLAPARAGQSCAALRQAGRIGRLLRVPLLRAGRVHNGTKPVDRWRKLPGHFLTLDTEFLP